MIVNKFTNQHIYPHTNDDDHEKFVVPIQGARSDVINVRHMFICRWLRNFSYKQNLIQKGNNTSEKSSKNFLFQISCSLTLSMQYQYQRQLEFITRYQHKPLPEFYLTKQVQFILVETLPNQLKYITCNSRRMNVEKGIELMSLRTKPWT